MAFAQVVASSSGGGSSSGTSGYATTLPSGVEVGDRLLCLAAWDASSSDTLTCGAIGSGWTKLYDKSGEAVQAAVFWKDADGTDALTLTLSGNSSGESGAYVFLRITGHDPSSAPEAAAQSHVDVGGGGTSTDLDAPNLAPSWGSADTLWLWMVTWDNASRTLATYPTNYSNDQITSSAGATSTVGWAVASRELTASSENPGIGTITSGDQWIASTVAIRPEGGGGPATTTLDITTEPVLVSVTADSGAGPVSTTLAITTESVNVSVTGAVPTGGDVRLQFGIDQERGGVLQDSGWRYTVFADETQAVVVDSGTLDTDSSGVGFIDLIGSPFEIGDFAPVLGTLYDDELPPEDRVVRTFFGFVPAIAIPE